MFGDVEKESLRVVEFDFETADPIAVLVHIALAAQRLDLLEKGLDVFDQDAEVVQTRVIEPPADLVGLELEDRQNDGFSPPTSLVLPNAGKVGYGARACENALT